MLAISLTLALFQAPDLAKKVTFTSVAKPVKQILQELSPQAGFPLMTSQVTEDEVLVVRFNDVPVGEAMKRIADATNTEWQEEQGGYRLIRSAARAQQEEREALAKRTEEIRKAIAKKLEKASLEPLTVQKAEQLTNDFMKLKPRSDGMNFDYSLWQQSNRLEQSTASGRLMNRLIGLLNPQEIARIPAGDRVVFSSLPTAMQRRFSGNVRDALAAFAKDHSVWIEAAKRIAGDDVEHEGPFSWSMHNLQPIEQGVKKVLLVVMHEGYGDSVHLELKVLDGKDRIVAHQGESLNQLDESDWVEMLKGTSQQKDDSAEIELSELSKHFVAFMKARMTRGGNLAEVPEALRKAILKPEEHDPLSFVVSDGWIGVAKAQNKNLVASLPDEAVFLVGVGAVSPKITVNTVLRGGRSSMLRMKDEAGWITVTPADRLAAQSTRVDRAALGAFLRAIDAKGLIAIDDAAKLALSIKHPNQVSAGVWFALSVVLPHAEGWSDANINLLRLYGTLNAAQRNGLRQGGRINFAQLSPAQKLYVNRMVFGRYTHFDIAEEAEMAEGQMERLYGLMQEPTELLPNGLPNNGFFTLASEDKQVLYAFGDEYHMRQTMSPDELAWQIVYREDPERFEWVRHSPELSKFLLGNQLQLDFKFHLTPLVSMNGQLHEDRQSLSAKPLTYKELPADTREYVEKKVAEYKKMFERMPNERGSNRKPPPAENLKSQIANLR